uniref:Uncharacterized protein n=1 Tax=Parascaris univalens TaxID=6257 RepID=A0A915B7R6_PARUN
IKCLQEVDVSDIASANDERPPSAIPENENGNAEKFSSSEIVENAEANGRIELDSFDDNLTSNDDDHGSHAGNNAYNRASTAVVDSERVEREDHHNETIDGGDSRRRNSPTISAGVSIVDTEGIVDEAVSIARIGSDSNQTQQSERHLNGTDPESNDSKRLSLEVINTVTDKRTPVENNIERGHIEGAKLSPTESLTNETSNVLRTSMVRVSCGKPLHPIDTNITEEEINATFSIEKDMSISSTECSQIDESTNIVSCIVDLPTMNSTSNRNNKELLEESDVNIKIHKLLHSNDRESTIRRDSIASDFIRNQEKLDSNAFHVTIEANEFDDGIGSVDRAHSTDNIRNSNIISVYSSDAEIDGDFNGSNEFIDNTPNSSNSSTILDEETKTIRGDGNRQQTSDSETESAPNTARRIVQVSTKSSDSTNIDDRTSTSRRIVKSSDSTNIGGRTSTSRRIVKSSDSTNIDDRTSTSPRIVKSSDSTNIDGRTSTSRRIVKSSDSTNIDDRTSTSPRIVKSSDSTNIDDRTSTSRIVKSSDSTNIDDRTSTSPRIVKSSDSTNIGDRTSSSIKTDENSGSEIDMRRDDGNERNINNENTSGEKFSTKSCNENTIEDRESSLRAINDESNECDRPENITGNERRTEEMNSNHIYSGSDADSLTDTEQSQHRSIEREIDSNCRIGSNVSEVIDIENTENSKRKISTASKNNGENSDKGNVEGKCIDARKSDDGNYERIEPIKANETIRINVKRSPSSSSSLQRYGTGDKSIESIEEDSFNGTDKQSTGRVRDTEQQVNETK